MHFEWLPVGDWPTGWMAALAELGEKSDNRCKEERRSRAGAPWTSAKGGMAMANMMVKHLLDEIARLSPEEQGELLEELPQVLHRQPQADSLQLAAVQEAIATRERIRRRLLAQHQPLGSVDADLEAVRQERLADLTHAEPPEEASV
jgi:hypothetical protein